jgi:putative oxygen-independent coproporphyrinogen III oxidase
MSAPRSTIPIAEAGIKAAVKAPGAGPSLGVLPPLSLYVHIPWCVRKCPYCDFNSHEAKADFPEGPYSDALLQDLEAALPSVWGRRVYSIFFGGGTPSLFSAESIDRLIAGIRARMPLAADSEVTLEANPGTFEAAKFRDFRAAGINRLSIGIQSFDPAQLKALGRIHDDTEARHAIEIAQSSFDNINLDLMYALPGQTIEQARADASEALRWQTRHLSFYHLTIEPNTVFEKRPPVVPGPDESAAIEDAVHEELAAAGYGQYETSAWARPRSECRHNMNYWQFGDYLGIGAGAHSKISFASRVVRSMRTKQPREYLKRVPAASQVQEQNELNRSDLVFEFMMNALRLRDGFAVQLFTERTGLPLTAAQKPLSEAEARGLIERTHERIRPTERGRRFLNDLLAIFLPG